MMTLFHGSEKIIREPIYGYGKPYNDYGLGFYCTEERDVAMEWAVRSSRSGFANRYSFDEEGLRILRLTDEEYTALHWLAVLINHREFDLPTALATEAKEYLTAHFMPDIDAADVIVGYRADDRYFAFASDFLNGSLSYRQLTTALHLGKLGLQVVLRSKEAFSRIVFDGYEVADRDVWYPKMCARDRKARKDYYETSKKRDRGGLYITTILDEEVKADDPRLR